MPKTKSKNEKLQVVLGFPSNQFGHQENSNGQEILNALKYVRPGNGFEPKCVMFNKVGTYLSTLIWVYLVFGI